MYFLWPTVWSVLVNSVRLGRMKFCHCFPQYSEHISQVDWLMPAAPLHPCWLSDCFPFDMERREVQLLTEAMRLPLSSWSSGLLLFFLFSFCILKCSCCIYKYLRTLYPFHELIFSNCA